MIVILSFPPLPRPFNVFVKLDQEPVTGTEIQLKKKDLVYPKWKDCPSYICLIFEDSTVVTTAQKGTDVEFQGKRIPRYWCSLKLQKNSDDSTTLKV